MPVPKAAVNKNNLGLGGEYYVGSSGEAPLVKSKAVPQAMKQFSNADLRSRIFAFYLCHSGAQYRSAARDH